MSVVLSRAILCFQLFIVHIQKFWLFPIWKKYMIDILVDFLDYIRIIIHDFLGKNWLITTPYPIVSVD